MLRHERFILVDMGNVGPMLEKLSHKAELVFKFSIAKALKWLLLLKFGSLLRGNKLPVVFLFFVFKCCI